MAISTIRRLAADIFNVGENKVRISPDGMKEAEGALTRSDVKGLIDKGIIRKVTPRGRASARKRDRSSPGRRRGTKVSSKSEWMEKVRAQRRFLKLLLQSKGLKKSDKNAVYLKIKSGIFRNKRAMLLYLKDNAFVAKEFEPPKQPAPALKPPKPAKQGKPKAPAPVAKAEAKPPEPKKPAAPVVHEHKAEQKPAAAPEHKTEQAVHEHKPAKGESR